ncbi:hypothetical protein GALAXY_58 [Arthrobacter phage Galaxy]|uniref:Uncharacterized protein n=1 Tax=Arthrobacter phage Galaxy TaxID=1772326 RepID=A0A0U4IDM9_9CAUD|nr:hypothetical protein FDG93_gp58 [Arthrobacter phage Galaxy]ALY08902.1 hypothetical protein GALAXY_58 [Arthrobacter phage Galaxy]
MTGERGADCTCDYEHISRATFGGPEALRTVWTRDPACEFPHIAGKLTGAPSSPGRPCGCLPGEECMFCRNSFAFRREVGPGETPGRGPFFRRNWEAIQDELSVDLRGEPVPGFKRVPFPERLADVAGTEVRAVLCSTDSHAGTVPAVVFGEFRVPWWPEGRAEQAAYCAACSRLMEFMGYFTPAGEEVAR